MRADMAGSPPELPEGFQGIMDPSYNDVHAAAYEEDTVPLEEVTPVPAAGSIADPLPTVGSNWPLETNDYQARRDAVYMALEVLRTGEPTPTASPQQLVDGATLIHRFLVGSD